MPPTRRYTRLRPMPEDGVRQSLFLPASDYPLVGKPTLTISLESVIFFLSILIIVGVLAQFAHDVYIIATFVLYPFCLTFHVILSPFVTLTQGLNILLRAILHVFVCIFTAIGTFIWLNIFSISLFLWFRKTLSATFFSKIDEGEDDTNDRRKRGKRCNNYHCPLPYQWQYRPYLDVEWKNFNAQDNCKIEELFCDPSKGIVNAPETEVQFKSYRRDSARDLNVLGYTVTIDFDDMLMTLRPLESQDTLNSQLRRLSTFDGSVDPFNLISMSWTWYWEDKGNIWRTYEKDYSERKLQEVIEQAYLEYLKEGKFREEFRFATAKHVYNLLFCPTGMYQVNLKTGVKRRVRRRPGKVISSEAIEDLKRKYEDSSYEQEGDRQLRAEKKNFPSHWTSMPPKSDYYRARTGRSSVEFKELESLFRMTMKDYKVRIGYIDRVQNLYMMEKYCRKKEKMRENQQTVDERTLFHGTTPDAVEAICKRNFDWRLSGKHATRFGRGSYFARDPSYSHRYARKDTHGLRHMFVAKVLVGSCTEGQANYRTPPPKNPEDPGSDLYDSCVDNQLNPSIFVVFDTDQLYPEYIISYSTVSKLDSADSNQYSLPQKSATPKRAILKSSTSQIIAFPNASRSEVPLQSNPSTTQAQVLQRTSTTSKRGIAQTPRSKTETGGPVVTQQSTQGDGIHAKLNPSSSQSRPGQSLNASYLATKKPSLSSTTDSYYSSRSRDFNLELSVTQDAHLSATRTAKELRQPNSLSFLCDHSTSNSGNEYLTTTIASSEAEDPSLPRSLYATGGNPSTTSMLWALDELEKFEHELKRQKESEECLIL